MNMSTLVAPALPDAPAAAPTPPPASPPAPATAAAAPPPRKRSKVSRACDACRRKKVKCDAELPGGAAPPPNHPPCLHCARNNEPCTFERIPRKRGPSKGSSRDDHSPRPLLSGGLGAPTIHLPPINAMVGEPQTTPQGMFWKVPYEMPLRRGSAGSLASSFSYPGLESDSEDERRVPLLPALLRAPGLPTSLLGSLNHRVARLAVDVDQHLAAYYAQCHPAFPVCLPLRDAMRTLVGDADNTVVDVFAAALSLVLRARSEPVDLRDPLAAAVRLFPLLGEPLVVLHLCALVLIATAGVTAGDPFTLPVLTALGVFHQLGIAEPAVLRAAALAGLPDRYASVTGRLYASLCVLDVVHAAAHGFQPLGAGPQAPWKALFANDTARDTVSTGVIVAAVLRGPVDWSHIDWPHAPGLPQAFATILRDKSVWRATLVEISAWASATPHPPDDETPDHQLRLLQTTKRITASAVALLSLVLMRMQQGEAASVQGPLLGVALAQCARLVALAGAVAASMEYAAEAAVRCARVRNDVVVAQHVLGMLRVPPRSARGSVASGGSGSVLPSVLPGMLPGEATQRGLDEGWRRRIVQLCAEVVQSDQMGWGR